MIEFWLPKWRISCAFELSADLCNRTATNPPVLFVFICLSVSVRIYSLAQPPTYTLNHDFVTTAPFD